MISTTDESLISEVSGTPLNARPVKTIFLELIFSNFFTIRFIKEFSICYIGTILII